MKRSKILMFCLCAGLVVANMSPVYAEETETEVTVETIDDSRQLTAPTDFTLDPNTGEYSFVMTDENVSYYFIRFYPVIDGVETSEYSASSSRIDGGKTGETSGVIDLSDVAWGTFDVNLVSYAAAGTDYINPDPVTMTIQYGVGCTLERPEMLAMASGDTVEFVVDWWTLCNYYFLEYLPYMQFTVYSDPECTDVVMTDVVDLNDLAETMTMNPGRGEYLWGWSLTEGPHFYTIHRDEETFTVIFDGLDLSFSFIYDIYTYQLGEGTYYATCQALARDEYTYDSQVSTVVEFSLTDEPLSEEFTSVTTEMWRDPNFFDMPSSNPGVETDRVDSSIENGISGVIIE